MPPITFVSAATVAVAGSITVTMPTSAKLGDLLFLAIAMQDHSTVNGPDEITSWMLLATLEVDPVAGKGQIIMLGRYIDGTEGASVSLDLLGPPGAPCAAAAVVYRGVTADPSTLVVASGDVDVTASLNFVCPALTLTRYSDMYVGVVFCEGVSQTFTPGAATTERVDQAFNVTGFLSQIQLFDAFHEDASSSGTHTSVTGPAASGMAGAILLAAGALHGQGKVITNDPPGAIGLPTGGV